MPDKLTYQEIRGQGMFPEALDLRPRDAQVVLLDNYMRRSLSMFHGIENGVANVVLVDAEGAARTQSHGSGFNFAVTDSDTCPSSYIKANGIDTGALYHRFDVLIESEQALMRWLRYDGTYVSDIPLLVGFYSLLITTKEMAFKKRNATAGTYHVTAYR